MLPLKKVHLWVIILRHNHSRLPNSNDKYPHNKLEDPERREDSNQKTEAEIRVLQFQA